MYHPFSHPLMSLRGCLAALLLLPGAVLPMAAPGARAALGPHTGAVQYSRATIAGIQSKVGSGAAAYLYYLNPMSVVRQNLKQEGFIRPFTIALPVRATVSDRSRFYEVYVTQPVHTGPTGIWAITRITARSASTSPGAPTPTPIGVHTGVILHSRGGEQRIQSLAAAKNSAYTYFLNPARVLWINLGQYGFAQPVLVANFTVTVRYQGKLFDVTLIQPAKRGPGGAWLITAIGLHNP